jgi:hypothetical protein
MENPLQASSAFTGFADPAPVAAPMPCNGVHAQFDTGRDTRSDVDLESHLRNRLWWCGFRGGPALSVTVRAGWATVSGQVHWAFEQHMVLHVLRATLGVTGVTDHLVRIYQIRAAAARCRAVPPHGIDAVTHSRWS